MDPGNELVRYKKILNEVPVRLFTFGVYIILYRIYYNFNTPTKLNDPILVG